MEQSKVLLKILIKEIGNMQVFVLWLFIQIIKKRFFRYKFI